MAPSVPVSFEGSDSGPNRNAYVIDDYDMISHQDYLLITKIMNATKLKTPSTIFTNTKPTKSKPKSKSNVIKRKSKGKQERKANRGKAGAKRVARAKGATKKVR